MKKILITGGDGFLAKSLYESLKSEYDVISCNRSVLDLTDSIAVFSYLKSQQFDVVIHTATYDAAPKSSLKDSNKVLENNLLMFFNISRCSDFFGKMIYFGSGAEYDRRQWVPKMKEEYFDKYVPGDQYGLSKYIMTKHALLSNNIINLRLFGVFGRYDDCRYRFISNACCYAVMNKSINIYRNACVDFLYINDLIIIVRWFIENISKYNVYNVCSGSSFFFDELAKSIIFSSGKDLDITIENGMEGGEYSGDNALLIEELSGLKFTPIEQSLKSLYDWYDCNKNDIDISKFHY